MKRTGKSFGNSREVLDVFPYGKPVKDSEGFDQSKLEAIWRGVFGDLELPTHKYGYFVVPLLTPHQWLGGSHRRQIIRRFTDSSCIAVKVMSIKDFPGRIPDLDVGVALHVGVVDGAVWNEHAVESLVRFWSDRLYAWWEGVNSPYLGGESTESHLIDGQMAVAHMLDMELAREAVVMGASRDWK
jgi:hypothetical protein